MGLLAGVWVRGLLIGSEMTQTAASPRLTPACVTAHKSREPGTHCIACRQLTRLENVLSSCLGCSKPLPGELSWFLLLSGGWSGLESLQLLPSRSPLCSSASFHLWGTLSSIVCSGGEKTREFGPFQGLPEAKNYPAGRENS